MLCWHAWKIPRMDCFMADNRSYSHIAERRLILVWKHLFQRLQPAPHQCCLFVAGMQRSGTNMVMDVLERSLRTEVFHETDPRAFHDYELLDQTVLQSLVSQSNAPVKVFKALLECDLIPHLLDNFSPAKAIWPVRDYRDVINSARRSFPHLKRTIQRMLKEPSNEYWQSRGVNPTIYNILSAHYDDNLSIEDSAALFWFARNHLYFDLEMSSDERIMLIRYEDLVTRPEKEFRDLFAFAGLPFSSWIVRNVHARSVARNRQPKLREPIAQLCEDLYQRFHNVAN